MNKIKRNYKEDAKSIAHGLTKLLDHINDCVLNEFDHNYAFDDTFIFYNGNVLMIDNSAKTRKKRNWREVDVKKIYEVSTDVLDFYPHVKKYVLDGFVGIITGDFLHEILYGYTGYDSYGACGAGSSAGDYFWEHFYGKNSILWKKGYTYNEDFTDFYFTLILPCEEWAFENLKRIGRML